MKMLKFAVLLAGIGFSVGCSSDPGPAPELTPEVQEQIEAEDAAVEQSERNH